MNDEQKRYTIKQIDKYNEKVEKLDQKIKQNSWFIYGSITLIIICAQQLGYSDIPKEVYYILNASQYIGIGLAVGGFRYMIENMFKKAGLENMVTDLEYQLHMDDLADKEEDNDKGHGL